MAISLPSEPPSPRSRTDRNGHRDLYSWIVDSPVARVRTSHIKLEGPKHLGPSSVSFCTEAYGVTGVGAVLGVLK